MHKIPFAKIDFEALDLPTQPEIESRFRNFIYDYRRRTDHPKSYEQLSEKERTKIRERASNYVNAKARPSGAEHLGREDRKKLELLRGGIELRGIENEHQADEIASAIHTEMPWMAAATEKVWQELRLSVRRGEMAPRLSPILLVGPPGIGKSHWARLVGKQLSAPTTVLEATNEPASFSIAGSQRGWSTAGAGKPLETILATRVANPVIIIDEVEKAGTTVSTKGFTFNLTQGLLPLLERSTAANWPCPYFRVNFDMSWITWVMTANSLRGLPQPFLSRCPPLELAPLNIEQLCDFAQTEGAKRDLPSDTIEAAKDVLVSLKRPQSLSLRSVIRLLDSFERSTGNVTLH